MIGLGTWQTFDVGEGKDERAACADVLKTFLAAGATLVDSSPMYGRAEQVTGDELHGASAFLATKVWTSGKQAGLDQMARSMTRMKTKKLDLMQVHNLLDWKTHLPVLREWKAAGKIRYVGVTHYQHDAFDQIEKILHDEAIDFVQIPYSIVDRAVEKRILPAAKATGTAVLVMTPFESGELFKQVKGKSVPEWCQKELGCTSWAQVFLKFVLGHPVVNCPLPATRDPKHIADNVQAGTGAYPDDAQREKLAKLI